MLASRANKDYESGQRYTVNPFITFFTIYFTFIGIEKVVISSIDLCSVNGTLLLFLFVFLQVTAPRLSYKVEKRV